MTIAKQYRFSGHDRTVEYLNSQELWSHAQDLKTQVRQSLYGHGRESQSSMSEELLAVDGS